LISTVSGHKLGALDPDALYTRYLLGEKGHTPDQMAYQDRGIDASPYKDDIASYPQRLANLPGDGGLSIASTYPPLGTIPDIDTTGLDFLHPDILEACVCIGRWDNGKPVTTWLGRNALEPVQMWSATKIIPMTHTVVKANQAHPTTSLDDAKVTDPSGAREPIAIPAAFDAIVSYRQGASMSNQLARMFKQFDTPAELEGFLQNTTGNRATTFRGGYGEPPYIESPQLRDASGTEVLKAAGEDHRGDNFVSAYDLCRLMTQVAWHPHLAAGLRLPGAVQSGIDTLVRGLGTDSARFTDVAFESLGLQDRVQDPVIISKLGFGLSDIRKQWEQVYTAYVQFKDAQSGQTFVAAMALRGARPGPNEAALELDARMATEVTRIIDRLVDGTLGTAQQGSNPPAKSVALAKQILNTPQIVLDTTLPSGMPPDGADAYANMTETAAGKPATRSSYGTAPGGSTALDPRMLAGLLSMHDKYGWDVEVSCIAGGEHAKNSRHYAGLAVDIWKINGEPVSASHPLYKHVMAALREQGATEVLGPGDPGHAGHVHGGWPRSD
jgi:hypothetical protein